MVKYLKKLDEWKRFFDSSEGKDDIQRIYLREAATQPQRHIEVGEGFTGQFGDKPFSFISAPGRTELSGNHTDHQRGRVLAAAVTLDLLAAVAPTDDGSIKVFSEGYGMITLHANDTEKREDETNSTEALVRGVLKGVQDAGFNTGGFEAYIVSSVPQGSGLSSSAAIEVLLGTILSYLYNGAEIPPVKIAQIGQYAENTYFGKPCGLMDQTASAVGGVISIDFEDKQHPVVDSVPFDTLTKGYTICILNSGGSHADLTPEYAAIPAEMRQVAECLGGEVLGEIRQDTFFNSLPSLRGSVPDRALLRAMHFYEENQRVPKQAEALGRGDIVEYMRLMLDSGYSSYTQLQNIYPGDARERSVALALAMSRFVLDGVGAWRVHGGGFAGTIQALMPNELLGFYTDVMNRTFGSESCYALQVRPVGGYALDY